MGIYGFQQAILRFNLKTGYWLIQKRSVVQLSTRFYVEIIYK